MNIVVIPARFGSTRFPGKPLTRINGRTMIWHVYHRSLKAAIIDEVWVATDDERIYEEVKGWGGKVMMTRADHGSGTDRVAEVASKIPCEIVVNVQGDEPMIDPEVIDAVVKPLMQNPSIGIVTPVSRLETLEEFFDPTVAKVVRDAEGFALYFSRSPIPYSRGHGGFMNTFDKKIRLDEVLRNPPFYRHVGLYGYHKKTLLRFCDLPASPLEEMEKLEQLRALEYGIPIYTVTVDYKGIGVDTPEDAKRVEDLMKR
jgi:3-deoxy-manno-octulosonate cytidylyltransferase (CMP-KDO synthetase)